MIVLLLCVGSRGGMFTFVPADLKEKKGSQSGVDWRQKFYDSKVASSKTNNMAEDTEVGLIVDYFRNRQGCGRQAALEHGLSYCIVRELSLSSHNG